MSNLTICLNLDVLAPTQFSDYDFDSFASFGGVPIAAGPSGIFQLDQGDLDDTSPIDAWFETVTSALGSDKIRHLLNAILKYETDGVLELQVTVDESELHIFVLPTSPGSIQRGLSVYTTLSPCGTYFTFRITNVAGADFAVDSLYVILELMNTYTNSKDRHGAAACNLNAAQFSVSGVGV